MNLKDTLRDETPGAGSTNNDKANGGKAKMNANEEDGLHTQHTNLEQDDHQRLFENTVSRRQLELMGRGGGGPEMTIPENSAGEREGNDASNLQQQDHVKS